MLLLYLSNELCINISCYIFADGFANSSISPCQTNALVLFTTSSSSSSPRFPPPTIDTPGFVAANQLQCHLTKSIGCLPDLTSASYSSSVPDMDRSTGDVIPSCKMTAQHAAIIGPETENTSLVS